MVSSKFCGCNAIDYCNSLPGSTCLVFKAADIINSLVGYDQIFRRVLKFAKQNPNYEVTILLDVDEDSENASDLILSHAKAIWQEMEDVSKNPVYVRYFIYNLHYLFTCSPNIDGFRRGCLIPVYHCEHEQ